MTGAGQFGDELLAYSLQGLQDDEDLEQGTGGASAVCGPDAHRHGQLRGERSSAHASDEVRLHLLLGQDERGQERQRRYGEEGADPPAVRSGAPSSPSLLLLLTARTQMGISSEGLKSTSICIELEASKELLELRELLAEVEAIGKNQEEWDLVTSCSDRFKAGEGTSQARLDRKVKAQGREEAEWQKAAGRSPAAGRQLCTRENVNGQVTEGHDMAQITSKLAQLRERKALQARR
eukprot:461826-Hanusia_phi.AAC.2